jgi:acetyl-CoA acetyltransferase
MSKNPRDVVVVAAVRTPVGKANKGALKDTRPDDLLTAAIKGVLGWEPDTPLNTGLAATYAWIEGQYHARKAGKRVGVG